jgi:hypothetical protein
MLRDRSSLRLASYAIPIAYFNARRTGRDSFCSLEWGSARGCRSELSFRGEGTDAKLVAVSLSTGGSESGDVHVYDVASGREKPGVVKRVNGGTAGGSVAWDKAGAGLYYTRYPREGERPPADVDFFQQVWFHSLAGGEDRYELGKDFPRIAESELETSDDGRFVLAEVQNGDGGEVEHHLLADGKWGRVTSFADKVVHASFARDGSLLLLSRSGAPRGKILRLRPGERSMAKAETVARGGGRHPALRRHRHAHLRGVSGRWPLRAPLVQGQGVRRGAAPPGVVGARSGRLRRRRAPLLQPELHPAGRLVQIQ